MSMMSIVASSQKTKTKIPYLTAFTQSGIPTAVADKMIERMKSHLPKWKKLVSQSFLPDKMKSDYRVMLLDADYQYALVGSGSDKYLWILSRTPHLSDEDKALILAEAQRRGYDTTKLIWVRQE